MGAFRCFFSVLVVVALGLPAAAVHAQRSISVERFVPALDGEGFLGVQATRTPGPFRYNFGLVTSWSVDPLIVRDTLTGDEIDVIDHRVTSDFIFQLGIGGRFAAALDVPLVLFQDTSAAPLLDGSGAISATALSDPRVALRYRYLGEDSVIERERNEGPGVATQVSTTLPLGTEDAFSSEQGVVLELQQLADFHVLGAGVGASLGWRHRFRPQRFAGVRFRDELNFGAALKLPIPVTADFLGILEVRGITDAGAPFRDGETTAVEGDLGFRIRRGSLTATAGVGMGFTGGVGSPSIRTLASLSWSPRLIDSDGDQIPDSRDTECPFLAEDYDGFEDSDGCLDPDNDNDLIPDEDDLCPDEAAEEFRDEDEDGCTDPLVDADGDGVGDEEDACPEEAEDADGHQDEDGCPDPDNDGDGVPDATDGCAAEAEDMDGYEDEDGCPEPDNDGDGRPDMEDRCPLAAEDTDGFEDEDGCPDPDNDRDGVVDEDDRCPEAAEVINGESDSDGCPDTGGRSLWRLQGEGEALKIRGSLAFAADHAIAPGALPGVDQLAMHLIAHWPQHFRITIGTDVGARREALLSLLVDRGVSVRRVEIVGDASLRGSRVVAAAVSMQD